MKAQLELLLQVEPIDRDIHIMANFMNLACGADYLEVSDERHPFGLRVCTIGAGVSLDSEHPYERTDESDEQWAEMMDDYYLQPNCVACVEWYTKVPLFV